MATLAEIRQQYPQYSDMSDADLSGALYRKFYNDMPRDEFDKKLGIKSKPDVNTTVDVLKSGGVGVGEGLIGLAGMPADSANLLGRGVDKLQDLATNAIGRPDWNSPMTQARRKAELFGLPEPKSVIDRATTGAITKAIENNVTGEFYKPQTTAGEYARTAGAFAPAVIGGPETLLTKLATRVALPSVAAESAGQLTKGTELEPWARAGGALLGAVTPAVASRLAAPITAPAKAMYGAWKDPEGSMLRQTAQAMEDAGMTPQAARAALDEARAQGVQGQTLADVLGKNVQQRVATYAKTPGQGKEDAIRFLEERSATHGENVVDVARRSLGNPEQTYSAIDKLIEQRALASKPAYDKAMMQGANGVWSPELQRLAGAPAIREAAEAAIPSLANRGITEGFKAPRQNPLAYDRETGLAGLSTLPNGNARVPDLRFWDQVKRGLDAQIAKAVNHGDNARVGELTGLKNTLVAELDQRVPSYAAARAVFESPSASKKAIESGMTFLSMRPEEITRAMKDLSTVDREFARLGTVRALKEKVGGPTDRMSEITSRNMRERLAAVFPDQRSYAEAVSAFDKIRKQNEFSRKVRGGSPTYENFADAGEARLDPGMLRDAATMDLSGLAMGALRGVANRFGGITPDVAKAGVSALLSPDAARQAATLAAVEQQIARMAAQQRPTLLQSLGGASRRGAQSAGQANVGTDNQIPGGILGLLSSRLGILPYQLDQQRQ